MATQKIVRKTVNGKHVYSYRGDNREFTGITTILGMIDKPWITDWKLGNPNWEKDLRRAAMIGSIVHKYCQMRSYIGKDKIDRTFIYNMKSWSEIMNAINAFELFMYQYQPKFIQSEYKCIGMGYGCTIDAVLDIKGKIHVVDYKTSSSVTKEHKIQVVMCAMAYLFSTPELPPTPKTVFPAILHLDKKTGKQRLILVDYLEFGDCLDIGTSLVELYNRYTGAKIILNVGSD